MKVAEISPLLKSRGLTQAELARRLGISRVHVTQLLNGKRRMNVNTMHAIEAILATAEPKTPNQGVGEAAHAKYVFEAAPKPKLSAEEKALILRELKELAEAYKHLPRVSNMTDEEILGYDENGLPT